MPKKLRKKNNTLKTPLISDLKRTYPNLFKSFYSSHVAKALILSKDNTYIDVNRSFMKLFECPKNKILGKTPDELGFWADANERKQILNKFNTDQLNSYNFNIKTLKGRIKNVIISSVKISMNDVDYLIGDVIDNTEKRNFEEKLKNSEEQYKHLFYKNPVPMMIYDLDSLLILSVNDAAIRKYGYKKNEFKKLKLTDLKPINESRKYHDFWKILKKGKNKQNDLYTGISKHRKKNGETIDVDITLTEVSYNGKEAILVLANDITDKLQSEQNLKHKNEEIKLLYEAHKDISSTLDPDEIYNKIYKIVKKHISYDAMNISSYDESTKMITCIASWNDNVKVDHTKFPKLPLEPGNKGLQSEVIRTGKSKIYNDYEEYSKKSINKYYTRNDGTVAKKPDKGQEIIRSVIMVPMKLESKVIGVIWVMSIKLNAYTPDDLNLLEALSAQISTATANALLFNKAQKELNERQNAEKALKDKSEEIGRASCRERV